MQVGSIRTSVAPRGLFALMTLAKGVISQNILTNVSTKCCHQLEQPVFRSAVRIAPACLGEELRGSKVFGDFQGSGWKLASFLRGVSQGGSLSVFSLPYLALSLPWLMKLGGHTASFRGAQTEARQGCWSFRGFQNFKRRYLSSQTCQSVSAKRFEHLERQVSKFRMYTS